MPTDKENEHNLNVTIVLLGLEDEILPLPPDKENEQELNIIKCYCLTMACSEKKEERMRGGHVTGSLAGGSREGLQRGRQTQFTFSEY